MAVNVLLNILFKLWYIGNIILLLKILINPDLAIGTECYDVWQAVR